MFGAPDRPRQRGQAPDRPRLPHRPRQARPRDARRGRRARTRNSGDSGTIQAPRPETHPGPAVTGRQVIERFIDHAAVHYYHPAGSCKMGRPAIQARMSRRRPDGRVHGIEGLYVADASLMPNVTSGNTNMPTAVIGEKWPRRRCSSTAAEQTPTACPVHNTQNIRFGATLVGHLGNPHERADICGSSPASAERGSRTRLIWHNTCCGRSRVAGPGRVQVTIGGARTACRCTGRSRFAAPNTRRKPGRASIARSWPAAVSGKASSVSLRFPAIVGGCAGPRRGRAARRCRSGIRRCRTPATRRRTPAARRAAAATSTTGRRTSGVRRRRRTGTGPVRLVRNRGPSCRRRGSRRPCRRRRTAGRTGRSAGTRPGHAAAGQVLPGVAGAGPDPRGQEDLDPGGEGGQPGDRDGDLVGPPEQQGVDRDNAGNSASGGSHG